MAVKFSQFNVASTIADIDYLVGYKSTDNVQIPVGLVGTDTTYTVSTAQSGANELITLTGSDASTDSITITAGTNITLTDDGAGNGFTISSTGIDGSGTTNYISKFTDSDTLGNSNIFEDVSGNVGIGTNSPDSIFHIFGNTASNVPRIKIEASGWSNDCRIERSSGSDGFYITNNYDTSTSTADVTSAGTSGVQIARGDLRFHTGASGSFTERMRITSSGNVGIGTASPSELLHIHSGDSGGTANNAADEVLIEGSGDTGLTISSPSTNIGTLAFGDETTSLRGAIRYDHSDDSMLFRVSSNTRMAIDSSGNVGIGTTSPAVKLDISGTDAVKLPSGTTGERPGTPAAGMLRYNSTDGAFEGYTTSWGAIGGGGVTITKDQFTGDNSTNVFTLSVSVSSANNLNIFISGVYQNSLDSAGVANYSVAGTTLTFVTAPPVTATNGIEVVITQ